MSNVLGCRSLWLRIDSTFLDLFEGVLKSDEHILIPPGLYSYLF